MNRVEIFMLILYVAFISFIFVGAGFISNVLFNSEYDTSRVGINTSTKLNIARLTIIMFWILCTPVLLLIIQVITEIKNH